MIVAIPLVANLARYDLNPTAGFHIGDQMPLSPRLKPSDVVRFRGHGYDGQFYLTIALDPLLSDPGTTAALDAPRYRYRRILFPVLGWALAGGRPLLIPWALLAILLASFGGLAATVGELARLRRRGLRGELLALGIVGAWVALLLGTADLLSAFLFSQALLGYELGRKRRLWAALALAGLARETSLLLIPAFVLAAFRRSGRRDGLVLATAALPALAWNLWVLVRVPVGGLGVEDAFAWPFAGLAEKLISLPAACATGKGCFEALMFVSLLATAVTALWSAAARAREELHLAAAAVVLCALLSVAGPKILAYYVGYTRVFLDLFVAAAVLTSSAGRAWATRAALGLQAFGSVAYVVHVVFGVG